VEFQARVTVWAAAQRSNRGHLLRAQPIKRPRHRGGNGGDGLFLWGQCRRTFRLTGAFRSCSDPERQPSGSYLYEKVWQALYLWAMGSRTGGPHGDFLSGLKEAENLCRLKHLCVKTELETAVALGLRQVAPYLPSAEQG